MTTSDKLREIADMWGFRIVAEDCDDPNTEFETIDDSNKLFSDLTALISEHYVPKDDYDKLGRLMDQLAEADEKQTSGLLRQRDELRERCKQLEFMIEKGLGWDDMKNDITMPHEL